MHLFSGAILLLNVLLITLCNSQSYSRYSYPVQRRAGYTYTQPYYNRQNTYYPSTSNRNSVYNAHSNPTTTNSYYQQTPQRNYKQTSSSYYPSTGSKGSYGTYNKPSSYSSGSRGSYQKSSTVNRNSVTTSSLSSAQNSYSPSNSINRNPSRGSYNPYNQQSTIINRNAGQTSSSSSYNSASDPIPNNQYLTNSYNNDSKYNKDSSASSYSNKLLPDDSNGKYRVSKADSENAKFAGANNQENEEDGRTLHLKRKKLRRRLGALASPCFPYGRDAGNAGTPPSKEQGRFLWDVNVVNVYPQTSVGFPSNSLGCGGLGGGLGGLGGFGGLGGGGLLSDPIDQPYYPPGTGLVNFLSLFAPGVLQNSLAVTARPQLYSDPIQNQNINNNIQNDDLQNDPEVDPNYRPQQVAQPIRRPNRIYYDSAGAAPITPGQLVGGVATTVNGIIQQLTGNVQPVYG